MSYKLVIKDAFWQIFGRILSALGGFIVIKIITPYLGPLRFGDYSTILKYFAIWSALADFGFYVIALKKLGQIKNNCPKSDSSLNSGSNQLELENNYGKFVSSRMFMIICVYTIALIFAYFVPSYTNNPYIIRGLPFGMLFSASFMIAGIVQLPIQLFWKMKQLSIALVIARISQLIILILTTYILFPKMEFDGSSNSIFVFVIVLISVVISGISQGLYVRFIGQKYIKLKFVWDWNFTKSNIFGDWKYGVSYYLSSFHTLIVLIILSIFYPTIQGFTYVGVWALALALIEILLIVPSSLGNSIIHKISNYSLKEKLKSFGYLMKFIFWIGSVFFINFTLFAPQLINFLGGKQYISDGIKGTIGSDYVLPFLSFVLLLSFIKQIFNYIFVSTDCQNKLLGINFFGVAIGTIIGIPLILKYNIIGGIITQTVLEILFVLGAIYTAYKNKIMPYIDLKYLGIIVSIITIFLILGHFFINIGSDQILLSILYATIINLLILAVSYKPIRFIVKNL